jgi:hypothetical protein
MADTVVTIKKQGTGCVSDPEPFKARRGTQVVFEFEDHPDAEVTFDDESPFDDGSKSKAKLKPDKNTVKSNAGFNRRFGYTVTWRGGKGSGSGEIIP